MGEGEKDILPNSNSNRNLAVPKSVFNIAPIV